MRDEIPEPGKKPAHPPEAASTAPSVSVTLLVNLATGWRHSWQSRKG